MSERIVCKPTPWFLLRAVAMLLMFGIFAVMFYKDGRWGYRDQNLSFYLSQAFKDADKQFKERKGSVTAAEWGSHAAKQTVPFPEDRTVLPEGTAVPMAWPAVLQDFDKMTVSLDEPAGKLFDDYRLSAGIKNEAPEEPFDARKIGQQWIVFWICLVLTIGALIVLLRTIRRSIAVDEEALYPVDGGKIPFADLVRMDLRKWDNKGLAFAWAKSPQGKERKVRIDGLTYGGFKKEQGEPAEALMRRLRENFRGEIIEYVAESEASAQTAPPEA